MASSSPSPKPDLHQYYTPIPSSPSPQSQQPYLLLLPLLNPHLPRHRLLHRPLISLISLLLLLAFSIFILFPSSPSIKISRLGLRQFRVETHPRISVTVSLTALVKVRNRAVYSMDYERIDVEVWYRGERIGHVRSKGGHVRARGSSWVEAVVEVDGGEVVMDWVYLVEDLAKGMIPFDSVTDLSGELGMFGFRIPIQSRISCEVDVNTRNQTIIHQNCYPE